MTKDAFHRLMLISKANTLDISHSVAIALVLCSKIDVLLVGKDFEMLNNVLMKWLGPVSAEIPIEINRVLKYGGQLHQYRLAILTASPPYVLDSKHLLSFGGEAYLDAELISTATSPEAIDLYYTYAALFDSLFLI